MRRAGAALVNGQLLYLRRVQEILQHTRGVRVRRVGKHRRWRSHERRAFDRVDDLDRALRVDLDEHVVLVAIDHGRALAAGDALGCGRRRLQLLHPLLRQLLEVIPSKGLRDCEGSRQAGAAIAGMCLDQLALPLRVEKVEIAGWRILGIDELGVVAHDTQRRAPRRVIAVGILELRRVALDVGRRVLREPFLLLPEDEVRRVR